MTAQTPPSRFSERLVPGLGVFVSWLLIIPAVALVMLPIKAEAAIPAAIGAYLVVAVLFFAMSPTIEVRNGTLRAARASIPVAQLGEIEALGSDALRAAIGPGSDARNFLLVRGWIHSGVKLEITDPNDPTPYWILTSRRPIALVEALEAGKLDAA